MALEPVGARCHQAAESDALSVAGHVLELQSPSSLAVVTGWQPPAAKGKNGGGGVASLRGGR